MDTEPTPVKEWETIAELSFEEQLVALEATDSLGDFMKGASEVVYQKTHKVFSGTLPFIDLPARRSTDPETGDAVEEIMRLGFDSGKIEITRHVSFSPLEGKVVHEATTTQYNIWGKNQEPQWKRYGTNIPKTLHGQRADYEPTEGDEATLRDRVMEGLAAWHEKQEESRARQAGAAAVRKTVVTLNSSFL